MLVLAQKKIVAAIMALTFALGLTACGESAGNGRNVSTDDSPESSASTQIQATAEGLNAIDQTPMHIMFANPLGTSTDQGFYSIEFLDEGPFLTYIDFDSQKKIPLCASPNCTHSDETCGAFLEFGGYLCAWKGKLYAMSAGSPDYEIESQLIRMDLDGTNREVVFTMEPSATWDIKDHYISDEALYINWHIIHNDGDYNITTESHTAILHPDDDYATEITPMLLAGDFPNCTIGNKVLVQRDPNLDITARAGAKMVLVDSAGNAEPWENPLPGILEIQNIQDGFGFYDDPNTAHFMQIDLESGETTDFGVVPEGCENWGVRAVKDGNVVLLGHDHGHYPNELTHHYFLATPDGIYPSQFSYYRDETRRSSMLQADVGNDRYLIKTKCLDDFPEYQIISKEDYWADRDSGVPVQLMW